jgi:hypothetical protein
MDAYLVEMMSIGGLSGSPVVAHMAPLRSLDGKIVETKGNRFYLLGLMHGHFDIQNLNEDVVIDDAVQAWKGIHTGIGVVVPVEKIIEAVEQPELQKLRAKQTKEAEEKGAKADLSEEPVLRSTDVNPTHREDFTRLLGAAARKPPQED